MSIEQESEQKEIDKSDLKSNSDEAEGEEDDNGSQQPEDDDQSQYDQDSNFDLFDEIERHRFQEMFQDFIGDSKTYVQAIND